jgi:hypothetical protein
LKLFRDRNYNPERPHFSRRGSYSDKNRMPVHYPTSSSSLSKELAEKVGSLFFAMDAHEAYQSCVLELHASPTCSEVDAAKNKKLKAPFSATFKRESLESDLIRWQRPTWYRVKCLRPNGKCVVSSSCRLTDGGCKDFCKDKGLPFRKTWRKDVCFRKRGAAVTRHQIHTK